MFGVSLRCIKLKSNNDPREPATDILKCLFASQGIPWPGSQSLMTPRQDEVAFLSLTSGAEELTSQVTPIILVADSMIHHFVVAEYIDASNIPQYTKPLSIQAHIECSFTLILYNHMFIQKSRIIKRLTFITDLDVWSGVATIMW